MSAQYPESMDSTEPAVPSESEVAPEAAASSEAAAPESVDAPQSTVPAESTDSSESAAAPEPAVSSGSSEPSNPSEVEEPQGAPEAHDAPVRKRAAAKPKADSTLVKAVDQAREAAEFQAGDFGVGEYLGAVIEGDRVLTHLFECPHPGYRGWHWSVTMARALRGRNVTVDEVSLMPGDDALIAPAWVPWRERVEPGDITPGSLLPTPDNDPRLEPGYTGGELAADEDPAEWAATRAVAGELGLGRERVLSMEGRDRAAERWLEGPAGPDDSFTKHAPGQCQTCGYFVRLQGGLGRLFGACTNEYSPFDAHVVEIEHGCGGHSDLVEKKRGIELPEPVFDTISVDSSLFD